MSRIRSLISASLAAAILAASASAVSAQAADEVDYASCPELTDSVRRLYGAYFLRAPDSAGYRYWLDVYSGPGVGLATISDVFASSTEFALTYGSLTDSEFVTLAYRNVFDREPDPSGLAHWTAALGRGMSRGTVMLSLSESREFVEDTGTLPRWPGI